MLERVSKCEENMNDTRILSIHIGVEVETEIQTYRPQRRLVTEAVSNGMAEISEMDIADARENVAGVVEQCPADSFHRKKMEWKTVLQIAQDHDIATAGQCIVKAEPAKGCGTTR